MLFDAFQTLAIDTLPRRCDVTHGERLPLDVGLSHPDTVLERVPGLYPAP